MAKTCIDTGLLSYNGTSQAQRPLDALLANCPKVDERTTADLILLSKKYSAYLNYFDLNNTVKGDWQGLMSSDSVVIIATLADWTTQDYAPFVKTVSDNAIAAASDTDATNYFKLLFDFAFSIVTALNNAYNQLPEDSNYATFLSVSINSNLSAPLNALIHYYNKFKSNAPDKLIDETSTFTYALTPVETLVLSQNFDITSATPLFGIDLSYPTEDILLTGSLRDDINHVLTHNLFAGVYKSFIDGVINIVSRTPAFLERILQKSPSHAPHYALYLAFLKLFAYAQEHLNQYTKKHLDFYYKNVLALTNSPAEADFVHLVFTLQKNVDQHLIAGGTDFKAGKDANNHDLFYTTKNDVVVQTASAQTFHSLFLNKGISPVTLFASPVANSADGQGAELTTADGSWFPFGDPQGELTAATLGFAIASNVLYLNEGIRAVTFTFNCDNITGLSQTDLSDIFNIQLTGTKAWYSANSYSVTIVDGTSCSLSITLAGDAPAIVPYSVKIHGGSFTTGLPMAQFILTDFTAYQKIKAIKINGITVSTNVDAVKNLSLQNDDGKIDTSKPFKLFGDFPDQGASLIIGSKEIFQKSLTGLTINLDWQQEPLNDTTINLSALARGGWETINSDPVSLYASTITINATQPAFSTIWSLVKNSSINVLQEIQEIESDISGITSDPAGFMTAGYTKRGSSFQNSGYKVIDQLYSLPAVDTNGLETVVQSPADFISNQAYDVTAVDGFIELELGVTDYNLSTFLNNIPQPSVTVNYDTTDTSKVIGYTVNKVTTPVATPPAVKSLTISYSAEDNLVFTNTSAAFNARSNFYYHTEPFGYREMHPFITADAPLTLLPVFNLENNNINDNGGELWIGLANALPDETFSVLFQVADGSANPLKQMTDIDWYYMAANNWVKFDKLDVTDSTNNLTISGIVLFDVPAAATINNTRADNTLLWIKAVTTHDTDAVCNLIAIDTNASKAQFEQNIASGVQFTSILAPNSISKPAIPDSALKQTQQPYSSFGGRVAETDAQFYVRVSERLRHKHRAITTWDYERLTLQYYPQIFKAKCLSHTGFILDEITGLQKYAETLAGQVTVITIPDLTTLNAANILRPYTSIGLLTEIQQYLQTLTSRFVTLNLCNPQFEEVQFDFAVTFNPNYDAVYFANQLSNDIEQFLSPWAFGNPQEIEFDTTIQKSVVLNFVEERYYVDYVTCFKMNQFVRNGSVVEQAFYNIEEAVPTTARSILVSYYDEASNTKHLISSPANCNCQ